MSTYLVAFVVCDYDYINNKTNKGVEVSIHTPPGLLNQATFALQTAVQLMDFYDDFFGVPYPLPKQGKTLMIHMKMQYLQVSLGYLGTHSRSHIFTWPGFVHFEDSIKFGWELFNYFPFGSNLDCWKTIKVA